MKNQQIAKIFNEIAEFLELKSENVFRIRAYQRAAQNIDGLAKDVSTLSDEELIAIPGIGKDLVGKIHEYLEKGFVAKHEELKKGDSSRGSRSPSCTRFGAKKGQAFV